MRGTKAEDPLLQICRLSSYVIKRGDVLWSREKPWVNSEMTRPFDESQDAIGTSQKIVGGSEPMWLFAIKLHHYQSTKRSQVCPVQ